MKAKDTTFSSPRHLSDDPRDDRESSRRREGDNSGTGEKARDVLLRDPVVQKKYEDYKYNLEVIQREGHFAPLSKIEESRLAKIREELYQFAETIGRVPGNGGKPIPPKRRKEKGLTLADLPELSEGQMKWFRALCDAYKILKGEARERAPVSRVIALADVPPEVLQAEAMRREVERRRQVAYDMGLEGGGADT